MPSTSCSSLIDVGFSAYSELVGFRGSLGHRCTKLVKQDLDRCLSQPEDWMLDRQGVCAPGMFREEATVMPLAWQALQVYDTLSARCEMMLWSLR